MSNNIVRDASDYLKDLDNKMNVFREKKETFKSLEEEMNKARFDENVNIYELGDSIHKCKELKKEVETSQKFLDEYNHLSKMYNESFERIKELREKIDFKVLGGPGNYHIYNKETTEEKQDNHEYASFYKEEIAFHEDIMRKIYEKLQKLEEKMFPEFALEKAQNLEQNKEVQNEMNTQENFNLDELIDMMTTEEMNTILQMKASGKYDDTILNNISTRLGVPVSKLEEIAAKKEAKLKEQEKDKEVEKDNNTNENSAGSNTGSSSDNDTQEKSNDEKTPKVDTQLEKPKKVKGIGKITGKLKSKINANAVIAVAAVAAGIAILAANPLAMGYAVIAGAGKVYMDYSKGKK